MFEECLSYVPVKFQDGKALPPHTGLRYKTAIIIVEAHYLRIDTR